VDNFLRKALDEDNIASFNIYIIHRGGPKENVLCNGTLPIQSFAYDSGCTLVRAEYGYPKGSPNTNS
jgi:hypothetical protein